MSNIKYAKHAKTRSSLGTQTRCERKRSAEMKKRLWPRQWHVTGMARMISTRSCRPPGLLLAAAVATAQQQASGQVEELDLLSFQVGHFQNTVTRCRVSPNPANRDCFHFLNDQDVTNLAFWQTSRYVIHPYSSMIVRAVARGDGFCGYSEHLKVGPDFPFSEWWWKLIGI